MYHTVRILIQGKSSRTQLSKFEDFSSYEFTSNQGTIMFVTVINTFTCRKSLKTCASTSDSMDMRKSNNRASWKQKMSIFTPFVTISRILYSVYLSLCFHWLSFAVIKTSIFRSRSIKNEGLALERFLCLSLNEKLLSLNFLLLFFHLVPCV